MHTCGHDSHTSSLLGVTKVLSNHRDRLKEKALLGLGNVFLQLATHYLVSR